MDSYSALQNSLKEGLQDTVVDNMEIDGLDSFPAGFSGYLDLKRFAVEDTYDFEEEEYKATPRENAYSFADTLFDPEFIRKSQRSEEDFYYYDDAYSFTKEYKEGKSLADIVPRAICSRMDLDNVLYEARLKVLKESNHLPADLAEKIAEGITEDADPIIISGDFQGADLSGIDFPEKITFRNCDFENCNLEGVHMAELSGSNLKNANIKNLVARSYVNNDDREAFNKGNILGCYTYADPTREQIKEWDAFHVKKRETAKANVAEEPCYDMLDYDKYHVRFQDFQTRARRQYLDLTQTFHDRKFSKETRESFYIMYSPFFQKKIDTTKLLDPSSDKGIYSKQAVRNFLKKEYFSWESKSFLDLMRSAKLLYDPQLQDLIFSEMENNIAGFSQEAEWRSFQPVCREILRSVLNDSKILEEQKVNLVDKFVSYYAALSIDLDDLEQKATQCWKQGKDPLQELPELSFQQPELPEDPELREKIYEEISNQFEFGCMRLGDFSETVTCDAAAMLKRDPGYFLLYKDKAIPGLLTHAQSVTGAQDVPEDPYFHVLDKEGIPDSQHFFGPPKNPVWARDHEAGLIFSGEAIECLQESYENYDVLEKIHQGPGNIDRDIRTAILTRTEPDLLWEYAGYHPLQDEKAKFQDAPGTTEVRLRLAEGAFREAIHSFEEVKTEFRAHHRDDPADTPASRLDGRDILLLQESLYKEFCCGDYSVDQILKREEKGEYTLPAIRDRALQTSTPERLHRKENIEKAKEER